MKSREAIAQFEATIILVVISLALASVVYEGLARESALDPEPVFVNGLTAIGGTPEIERLVVNSSEWTTIAAVTIDSASSAKGILVFDGLGYATTLSLCAPGATTFFSVLAQAGTLEVSTNGRAWVSGAWGGSARVAAGWQEVMIEDGSSCSVTLPGGTVVPSEWTASSGVLSSIPAVGPLAGTTFTLYLPSGGGVHSLLIASSGGLDDVSV